MSETKPESLLEACSNGNVERFHQIMQKWESKGKETIIDIKDNHNFGALHHAVRSCSLEMVQAVLQYKDVFDLKSRTFEGWTPLFLASAYPRPVPLAIVKCLLDECEDPGELIMVRNNEEVSVIHKAVEMNREDIVKELAERNADMNVLDLDRETPLHYAVRNGNLSMIQTLIGTGKVNPKLTNYVDFEPLCLTFGMNIDENVKLEIIKFLIPHTYSSIPNKPGYYSVFEVLKPTVLSCRKNNNILSSFFIKSFYKSEFNSKYPLIEKLEASSNISHMLCAFLHDEIARYDQYYCQLFRHLNIEAHIIRVILELISRDTPESVDLAVETCHALLKIHFDSLLKEEFLYQHPPDFEMFLSNFNEVPNPQKLFQFTYKLLTNDSEQKIFDLLLACLAVCDNTPDSSIFRINVQILMPFVTKDFHFTAVLQECYNRGTLHEIEEYIPYSIVPVMIRNLFQIKLNVSSLKRLSRDVVRKEISKVGTTSKDFIDRILQLSVPITLKCYLLNVGDSDWIKNL